MSERPESVPAEAQWDEEHQHWSAGQVRDGLRHGPWKAWRADGSFEIEWVYVDGVETGPFCRYHQNGTFSQKGGMKNDQRDGWITWQRSEEETTEITMPPHVTDVVWFVKARYEEGINWEHHFYDRDMNPVTNAGLPVPERPDGVPEEAEYDAGWQRWTHGPASDITGKPHEFMRRWWSSGELYEEVLYDESGEPTRSHMLWRDGSKREECEYRGGVRVLHRKYEDGIIDSETIIDDDGTTRRRDFFEDGGVSTEQATTADGATSRTEFWESGEVRARWSETPDALRGEDWDADDEPRWRTDFRRDGSKSAEGAFEGAATGPWAVFDADENEIGRADFDLLAFAPRTDVGTQAHILLAAQELSPSPALDNLDDVDWEDDYFTWFGTGEQTKFYLNGLTSEDDAVHQMCFDNLYNQTHHQGTYSHALTPAAQMVSQLLPSAPWDRQAEYIDYLVSALARGEYSLAAANQARGIVTHVLEQDDVEDVREEISEYGIEGAYLDVLRTLTEQQPLLKQIITDGEPEQQRVAARAIAFAIEDGFDGALAFICQQITEHSDRFVRAELIIGLVIARPWSAAVRPLVVAQLESDDELVRLAAALTLVRCEPQDAPQEAVDVLVSLLADASAIEDDYNELYWTGWELRNELVGGIVGLGPDRASAFLPRMAELMNEVDAIAAIGVAAAMLDVVMPQGYDEEEELDDNQRDVLRHIYTCERAWTFNVNMHEVLEMNGLPRSREALRDLIG